jgi:negative elongation factor C/D
MAPPPSDERPGANPLRQPELLRCLFDEAFRCNVGAAASADPGRAESRAQCVDLIVRAVTDGGEDEVAEARRALESATRALEAAARGSAPEPESFRGLVGYPPAAAGVIAWVSSAMGDPEHYRQVHAGASNQVYFGMLARAAVAQPRLRERALDAVGAALAAMGKGSSEALHLGALDVAVEMVEAGHVLPTIEAATERWSRHVDPSHLRYFAGEVLEVAGPPYGGRFASAMVRLLRGANHRRGMNRAIDEFVAQVRRQREGGRLHPNLAKEDDTFLDYLAK